MGTEVEPRKRGSRGPAPNPRGLLKPRVHVKCTEEWAGWVRGMADGEGLSVAELIEAALVEHAKRRKFENPPGRV